MAFLHTYSFTLDINTTHSTWVKLMKLMSKISDIYLDKMYLLIQQLSVLMDLFINAICIKKPFVTTFSYCFFVLLPFNFIIIII